MTEAGTSKIISLYCCNPFKKLGHNYYKKNLRTVNNNVSKHHKEIIEGYKICDTCRKAVLRLPLVSSDYKDSSDEALSESDHETEISTPEKSKAIEILNESLGVIDETPIKKIRLSEKKYPQTKLTKITEALGTQLFGLSSEKSYDSKKLDYDSEIITRLKEKFFSTTDKSLKMQILTTLPESWTLKQIESEFKVTNFIARKAKKLMKDKGIMSAPDLKPGKALSPETANLVKNFYECDEISRQMPGKKDFVSIKVDGKAVHVQKFLILNTLRESYVLFKEHYPDKKIGFSKFCELRPKNCVLAGSAGTHSVCVCAIHQNAKLMMAQCKLPELINRDKPIKTYKDLLSLMICEIPTDNCYFRQCNNCPDTNNLKSLFEDSFEQNSIDTVTYKQWMQIDNKTTLEAITKQTEDFLNCLFDSLPKLLKHSFIASQQSAYLRYMKENLVENQCIVLCDFAENYSFILQDAAQGFHWNNAQATIHPFVVYYMENAKLQHLNLVIISDCMSHDTVAVHLFRRLMIAYLKQKLMQKIDKIHYFSDGARSQYKNKSNFVNLCHHTADFSIEAEWNFFASYHGKNACDGIGGTVKRLAAQASLRMVYNEQIMTPRQLYEWSKDNIKNIDFIYSTEKEYEQELAFLKTRFEEAITVKGTQQFHNYRPKNKSTVFVKYYSFSQHTKEEIVRKRDDADDLDLNDIVGFVTCVYNNEWWLGCVLGIENEEVKVSFLEPHGPSPSFKYPHIPDVLVLNKTEVLTKVDPTTQTGRVYNITESESTKASKKLLSKLSR